MAKFQISSQLFEEEWFLELEPHSKLLWIYMSSKADAAGVWYPAFKAASMFLGFRVTEKELDKFGGMIRRLPSGGIALKGFIEGQYGKITENNNFHRHISNLISRHGLTDNDLQMRGTGGSGRGTCAPIVQEGEGVHSKEDKGCGEKEDDPWLKVEEVAYWNAQEKLPKVKSVSGGRQRGLKARRSDSFWKENFKAAVERIQRSNFCMGINDRGWRADFDWMLQPETVAKIMEGKYDDRNGHTQTKPSKLMEQAIREIERL